MAKIDRSYWFLGAAVFLLAIAALTFLDVYFAACLLAFGVISYLQNALYTWSSRSRNSGDPNYHRWAAWSSNSIYQLQRVASVGILFEPILNWRAGHGDPWEMFFKIAIGIVAYTLITSEGSVKAMKILIAKEAGKRKVTTQDQIDDLRAEVDRLRKEVNRSNDHYLGPWSPRYPRA